MQVRGSYDDGVAGAAEGLLDWVGENGVAHLPLLLCGDFNSGPLGDSSTAYSCLTGALEYSSSWVDKSIPVAEFDKCVTRENWRNALAGPSNDGCTVFGFTKPRFEANRAEFQRFMDDQFDADSEEIARYIAIALKCQTVDACVRLAEDARAAGPSRSPSVDLPQLFEVALRAKPDFFKPLSLWLDHFFTRFPPGRVRVVARPIPKASHVAHRFSSQPIPSLSLREPSDHLPIHLSIGF